MKVSLALRIFIIQMVFSIAAGGLAAWMVLRKLEQVNREWSGAVATLPSELPLQPFINEVADAYLTRIVDAEPEVRQKLQQLYSEFLFSFARAFPEVEDMVVVGPDRSIVLATKPDAVGLRYLEPDYVEFLSSAKPRRRIRDEAGRRVTEVFWPIYEPEAAAPEGGPRRRIGSLLVRYVPGANIRMKAYGSLIHVSPLDVWDLFQPVFLYLGVMVAGGVLLAALTVLPVRRLDRAVAEFRKGGYRGKLDPKALGLKGELASAAVAISELGGKLAALDDQGREREALLATLGQSMEEGMVALDPEGVPVAWNAAALRILAPSSGSERDEEQRPDADRLVEALRRNPIPSVPVGGGASDPVELEWVRPNGSRVLTRVTRVAFESRPGEAGTLLLFRDLEALRKVETHLLEAGRYAVLANLAAGVAHEIRNPLHSIRLNASVVEQYLVESSTSPSQRAVRESLATIQDETRRLADLLNNYLGMVRPSSGFQPLDARDLCRRVARLLEYTSRRSRVELRVEASEDLPLIEGVADRLQQAILNLVLNAIQAMPDGGKIVLRTRLALDHVQIVVSDSGPGLPQELGKALFDTRVTTKPDGTGLGLPLVRTIVEAHGGSVFYRSRPGEGTTFTLLLPLQQPR